MRFYQGETFDANDGNLGGRLQIDVALYHLFHVRIRYNLIPVPVDRNPCRVHPNNNNNNNPLDPALLGVG